MSIKKIFIFLVFSVVWVLILIIAKTAEDNIHTGPLQRQENIEMYTDSGDHIQGTILKDKDTGKEYIFIKGGWFTEDQLIPRE